MRSILLRGKEGEDGFGFGGAYYFCEVGFGLEAHLFDAAEFQEQVAGGLITDAGDVGELGAEGAFRAFVAVEGDGKAVHLVLYLFQQVEERVGGLEPYHLWRKSI